MLDRRRWLLLWTCTPALAQKTWNCRLVYDGREKLTFTALSGLGDFAIVGAFEDREKTARNLLLITTNSGKDWRVAALPEKARSLFARDHSLIWLVSETGLWQSRDEGESWTLRHRAQGLQRAHFVNDALGYAVGASKTVLKTGNGGAGWTPVPEAAASDSKSDTTVFEWIDFVSPRVGVITGASRPPRTGNTSEAPFWRDPNRSLRRPEWPGICITLETRDGGVTWKSSKTSLFGRISRMRYSQDGRGMILVEFHDRFDWPSEVYSMNLATGASERVFRKKDRAVTDLLLFPGGMSMLAAVEPPADPSRSVQGRLHLLEGSGGKIWTEVRLPSEIPAARAWMAGSQTGGIWVACDSGYVLRCESG